MCKVYKYIYIYVMWRYGLSKNIRGSGGWEYKKERRVQCSLGKGKEEKRKGW